MAAKRADTAAKRPAAKKRPAVKKKAPATPSATALKKLDGDLQKLLAERVAAFRAVIEAADDPSTRVLDPTDDLVAIEKAIGFSKGAVPDSILRRLYGELLGLARSQVKVTRVVYLGPEFSFSHLATIERFGTAADLVPVSTIGSVFEEVNRGHASFGVVPIENSTDGRVVDTLAMFTRLPVRICGEVQLNIHLNLLANGPRSEITEVYSKPQALSQCRNWLSRNMPQARLIEVTSTSTAAQLAKTKPGAAAVASKQASIEHGLAILAGEIEDNPHNVTRFAVIGEERTTSTGKDRTALLLQVPHEPGALHDALAAFKRSGVNLTWIESFPLRGPEGGYQFFLDFEGHADDAPVAKLLKDIEKKAVRLELLGSYPRNDAVV
ncbi:MAG: prephenate dehydratase [Planctomycetota bacterium]